MASFKCVCGNVMNNQVAPNDTELHVYTDNEWDNIVNLGMMNSVEIPRPSLDVWKCTGCQRIYIFGENRLIKRYAIEWEASDSD
jgi:hypothetical protein